MNFRDPARQNLFNAAILSEKHPEYGLGYPDSPQFHLPFSDHKQLFDA
jgi:hypothetical protein